MRFLFAALMVMAAIAAAANIREQIRNADRRGGHRMVELSRNHRLADFRAGGHPLA